MRATDALELHADMSLKMDSPLVSMAIQGHLILDHEVVGAAKPDVHQEARDIVENFKYHIKQAETFFVSADMCEMVEHSAGVLDSTDIADFKNPPCREGFVYFEKPLPVKDVRGNTILINAAVWTPMLGGNVIHMWNDMYATPDDAAHMFHKELPEDLKRAVGRWGYVGITLYRDGEQIGDPDSAPSEVTVAAYAQEGVEAKPITNVNRYFHALWLLMQQKITVISRERGDKRLVRRMSWAGLPGEVTVIQLRSLEYPEGIGEGRVEWKHRWIVRGFWRWQQYKNEEGAWARKRIWIDPYVKGPAGAPLKISKKVNAVVR